MAKFLSSPIWNVNIHAFLLTEIFVFQRMKFKWIYPLVKRKKKKKEFLSTASQIIVERIGSTALENHMKKS